MSKQAIRKKLEKYGLHIYQLANRIGIDRQTYYEWGYTNFSGHEQTIRNGIASLIKSKGDVADDD